MPAGDLVIPWGDGGWKGLNVARGALPGFEAPSFDDSAWPTISLPIGGGDPAGAWCPIHLEHPPATNWPENTDYLLRRTVTGDAFEIRFAIDNEATIFFDGVSIGKFTNSDPGTGDSCPERTDHSPQTGSLLGGGPDHVLAIRCRDLGSETYFDCEVSLSRRSGWSVGMVRIG